MTTRSSKWDLTAGLYRAGASPALPSNVPVREWRNATVLGNHDGDGLSVLIIWGHVGARSLAEGPWSIRLLGCNARELTQPGGPEARDHLAELLPTGTSVALLIAHDDNYGGRLDAQVAYVVDGQPRDLVSDLIAGQWAAPWNGSGSRPLPPWPRVVS